jgi:acyl carrier protein
MNELHRRLMNCFVTLFPGNSQDSLIEATPDSIEAWDSTNHFLLLQIVEEEFGLQIPEQMGGQLLSFGEFEAYLKSAKVSKE